MKSTIKRHNFKDDHDDDNHDEYDDNNNNRTTLQCHNNKGNGVTPFKYILMADGILMLSLSSVHYILTPAFKCWQFITTT